MNAPLNIEEELSVKLAALFMSLNMSASNDLPRIETTIFPTVNSSNIGLCKEIRSNYRLDMKQSRSQKAFGPKHKGKALLSSDASKLDTEMMMTTMVVEDFGSQKMSYCSVPINNLVRDVCAYRTAILNYIMKALTSGDNNTVGVWAPESPENADLLDKVSRRAKRDGLFDVVVMARVTQEPNYERIQDEIAESLGFKFDHVKHPSKRFIRRLHVAEACLKSNETDVAKRAKRLHERILMQQKVLVILRDLHKGIDLETIRIPSGADYTGCKLLLTSASDEVLAKQMHARIVLKV